ncbi:hypothetical protein HOY80DRAFT_947424 [Tuber brumale]|nr:hypothetical protein HOY80DRAFT_947424 [Tuber brumale]
MPGAPHENTGGCFIRRVEAKIELLPAHSWRSYHTAGGTRFSAPGTRSKEGDQGIVPSNRKPPNNWPTLVLEVGDSESLPFLEKDAKWWLENSGGKTKFVILIKITKAPSPNSFHIECWEMMPNLAQVATSSRTPTTPQRIQFFDIHAAGEVSTDPEQKWRDLTIPYDRIFDPLFPKSASDIIISNEELSEWALHIFSTF